MNYNFFSSLSIQFRSIFIIFAHGRIGPVSDHRNQYLKTLRVPNWDSGTREEQAMKPDWYIFDEAYDLDNINNEDREETTRDSGYQYGRNTDIWYS